MYLRISIGSAIALCLRDGELDCLPTTCYLMLGERCSSNCGFCAQARDAGGGDRLSRVLWPPVNPVDVAKTIFSSDIKRICVQTLDYPYMVEEFMELLEVVGGRVPVSGAINPLPRSELESLKTAGLERVGIGVDGASKTIFDRIKGAGVGGIHTWESTLEALDNAAHVFGNWKATTHIIVGMGETDQDVVSIMSQLAEKRIGTSLFAATPIRGTVLELASPSLPRYRAMQVARSLVVRGGVGEDAFSFDETGKLVGMPDSWRGILGGEAFMTQGCPDCNRPYYNERPGGEMYNYPCALSAPQLEEAISQVLKYGVR